MPDDATAPAKGRSATAFLEGGGEMGALMRGHDFSRSSLGPPASWPQSLRTVVRLLLNTGHPMYIWWGPEGACLYNDAYRECIGPERHPGSLGRPAREVWQEIWDIIGPQIEQVMSGGGATWHVNQLVPITRHGRLEDVYWTYSYSPIDDEGAPNGIGGVLVVCTETTAQVLLAKELAEKNRRKDEFLATLAHELRNPLAPVLTALEAMDLQEDASFGRERAIIRKQATHLARLVDDLLDLSRVNRGLGGLIRTRVSLRDALKDAAETSRPAIERARHELVTVLPAADVFIDGDSVRLVQVFTNLLNNAAKFTPEGGRIELCLETPGHDGAVVSVRDTGVGIPPEMLERVFDMFTQLDPKDRVGGGLGIGLMLVRRLVELHGGRVVALSEGAGRGSTFIVRLPLAAPATAAAAGASEAAGLRRAPTSSHCHIVVADDNVDAAEMLSMVLRRRGYEVRVAYDGQSALELAEELRPDVMILDVGMPRLGGNEVARRVRDAPWGGGVVLIAVSGWGQVEDKQRSLSAGFDHHLTKPVRVLQLETILRGETA